ncbi:MAG: phosphoribosylanthranilate isomerase [Mariprofundaceae bacterium]|nr:phosphoribosylanthranilate isomerase [Mariprofundaceae bacterium]
MFLEKTPIQAGEKRVRIKICGITRVADALLAAELGADAVGFVFYEKSPRFISPLASADIIRQLPPLVSAVGLFVNATQQEIDATLAVCPLDVLQLHGDETAAFCAVQTRRVIKAVAIRQAADVDAIAAYDCPVLLDAKAPSGVYGGAGKVFDWSLVANLQHRHPLLLAGGLHAENVAAALAVRHWHALDVSSGVESAAGIKDADKLRQLMAMMQSDEVMKKSN